MDNIARDEWRAQILETDWVKAHVLKKLDEYIKAHESKDEDLKIIEDN